MIDVSSYETNFESSKTECNVASYRLIEILSTGEIVDLNDDELYMGSNFEIFVNTSLAITSSVLIEASTKNSNSTAILELIV